MADYSVLERFFVKEVLPASLSVRFDVPLAELIPHRTRLRLDFVISYCGRTIAFEIDGHRSHFIDPKQIKRDEQKDTLCKKYGIELHRLLASLVTQRGACRRVVKRLIYGGKR